MSHERWSRKATLGLGALLALTAGLRLWHLGYAPTYDELFHLLAARAWLDGGTFCIADCLQSYDRGASFTVLVAGAMALFGESIEAARLPSVFAGTLLVLAVFLWMRRYASTRAAFIAAALCAVSPELLAWSQVSRFYAMQALLVWGGVALLYAAVFERDARRRVAALLGSLACLAVSWELQVSTLIPIVGLGLWLVGWLYTQRGRVSARTRAALVALALVAGIIVVASQWSTIELYWQRYRGETNLIHVDERTNPFYYHAWFVSMYSFLYALLPLAILVSLAARVRPAALLTVSFGVAFVAHSFGGFKGDRLILYAFPFFFGLWGIALAEVVPPLVEYGREAVRRVSGISRRGWLNAATGILLALSFLFAALNTGALQTTIRLLTVPSAQWTSAPWYRGHTDWEAVEAELQPIVDTVDVVVSSAVLKTLYYFDETDVSLSRTQLFTPGVDVYEPEFWRDWRHGRPVISSPSSIERLVSCYPSGLVLVEAGHWHLPAVVPPETAETIERVTTPVALPRGARARAFVWHTESTAPAADCDLLPRPGGDAGGGR